jgi:hypothetical protein
MPDAEKTVLLIRTAMLTLNDAVQTGNFTVLRDKAAPGFQTANTAARLSVIFQKLSQQQTDFSAVAVQTPQLSQAPILDPQGRLRLAGYFPGKSRLDFELTFEGADGRWRIFGISANLRPGVTQPVASVPNGVSKAWSTNSVAAPTKK